MQNSMRALGGLMALTLLAACGGDKEADSKVPPAAGKAAAAKVAAAPAPGKAAAPAPGKAAAPAPTKGAAPASAKSAASAKQAAAAKQPMGDMKKAMPEKKAAMGDMKRPAGDSKKAMGAMQMPAGEMKHDMSAMKPGETTAGMGGMSEMSGWKELDAFHQVLMDAWHPVATGDLAPARAKAAELLTAALAWRSSKGPAKCDNAAARAGMVSFIDDARSYADAAKRNASDDAIKVTLTRTHDGFEKIGEPCMADMMKGMKMDMPKKP